MPEIGAPHKTTHQDGGNDEISVAALSGTLADAQTPAAHKTSHQDGGADEISVAGLAGQVVFVPYNGKIADINESDALLHFLNLETPLSETRQIISLVLNAIRTSGTGYLFARPNEGPFSSLLGNTYTPGTFIIASGTQRLQYNQNVANDVYQLYCMGYMVFGV
mgnify:CR=1 FL=1